MKVLHLIDSGGLYGAENMLLALVREQVKQDLDPMILSAGDLEIDEKPIEAEARRLKLPITPWRMKPGLNLSEARKIIVWAKEQGYALMHSHGYKFNILAGLWPLSMRLPLVTTLHGYVRATRFSRMWFYEVLDRLILPRIQAVVLVNEPMKADLGHALQSSERVHVIPNGIDISGVECRAKEEPLPEMARFLSDHSPLILGVGRLSREKAFERLVECFSLVRSHCPQAGLLLVGEGRLREELQSQVERHNLGASVLMPGFYGNVPSLMARANALVIPSRTEGLPITLLEAMTLHLPVIASGVGAIPEVLDQGEGGWVVDTSDASKFGDALMECLKDNNQRSQKVCKAKEKVNRAYSSGAMATAYSGVYKKMVG